MPGMPASLGDMMNSMLGNGGLGNLMSQMGGLLGGPGGAPGGGMPNMQEMMRMMGGM